MKYMLQFISPVEYFDRNLAAEEWADYMATWTSYMSDIYSAGVVVSGEALQAAHTATTVKIRDGQRSIMDGPYIEAKEMLGGYLVIDVETLDIALEWASKSPSSEAAATVVWPILTIER